MEPRWVHRHRIESTLQFQFPGLDLKQILPEITVELSRKTRRIRVIRDRQTNHLLFALRPSDGQFLPSFEAARRIISSGYEKSVIVVSEEAAPFVAQGRSAFCRHVEDADSKIRPGDQVFVLDPERNLLAVGVSQHPGYALLELNHGVAVKIRHYRDKNVNEDS